VVRCGPGSFSLSLALVARVRSVAAPFGTDALVQFHRQIGLVGLALVGLALVLVYVATRPMCDWWRGS